MNPFLALAFAVALGAGAPNPDSRPAAAKAADSGPKLMYTTYFYTAGEAVVHGYQPDTKVRIVSMDKRGTVWEGTVKEGETQTIRTGKGVFGFLSDKKAAILVGTPSSCNAVGYFLKDEEGLYRSKRFFTQLPVGISNGDARVLVWAYDTASVTVADRTADKPLKSANLQAGTYLELDSTALGSLSGHVLEIKSEGSKVGVQVYYDEGFIVPADLGLGAGRSFYTYVGAITEGVNDLDLLAQVADANVTVKDVKTGEKIFGGLVKKGTVKALTMKRRYVHVTSDVTISVAVAAFEHYKAGYAEHHFGTGLEGVGIETEFLITTPGELWLFSYFDGNKVEVTDAQTGKQVFTGELKSGAVRGLEPGYGLFRVKSTMGLSVMGGSAACGADYSPAAGMFAVDEALFEVIAQIRAERQAEASKNGVVLSEKDLAAPMTAQEAVRASSAVKAKTGRSNMSADEINQRAAEIQAKH
ncbi:MAG TPA: hypothetical protein VGK67_07700 [Myxococcales bacterium]